MFASHRGREGNDERFVDEAVNGGREELIDELFTANMSGCVRVVRGVSQLVSRHADGSGAARSRRRHGGRAIRVLGHPCRRVERARPGRQALRARRRGLLLQLQRRTHRRDLASRSASTASSSSTSTRTAHDRQVDRPVVAAAFAEIGGAYLVWVAIRADKGVLVGLLGARGLAIYGVVAAFQRENEFGRVLAAYGGVFIIGSMAWGVAFDSFRPDRYDFSGAAICLVGVGVITYAPR